MEDITWLKQTKEQPLFPDVVWSRPENRQSAGKLLIIGGNLHAFSAVANAYDASLKAGVGSVRAILPDVLHKTIGSLFPEAIFAPSTQSGSFSKQALSTFVEESAWADGVLLSGDFGKNSETEILLESFISKCGSLVVCAQDSLIYFAKNKIEDSAGKIIIASFSDIQKIARLHAPQYVLRHDMNLNDFVNIVGEWSLNSDICLVTYFNNQTVVAKDGRVSTTKIEELLWTNKAAATVAVWCLQQPNKIFEAATCAMLEL